jgi:hypothetical protein
MTAPRRGAREVRDLARSRGSAPSEARLARANAPAQRDCVLRRGSQSSPPNDATHAAPHGRRHRWCAAVRGSRQGGEGCPRRPLQTSARRRPATEQSEGAQLGAPTKRVCGRRGFPSPTPRDALKGSALHDAGRARATERTSAAGKVRCRDPRPRCASECRRLASSRA